MNSICAEKSPLGARATLANVTRVYEHACAISSLMCVSMLDFMLDCVAKVDEDASGWRRQRMLRRAKFGYEQAERFMRHFTAD